MTAIVIGMLLIGCVIFALAMKKRHGHIGFVQPRSESDHRREIHGIHDRTVSESDTGACLGKLRKILHSRKKHGSSSCYRYNLWNTSIIIVLQCGFKGVRWNYHQDSLERSGIMIPSSLMACVEYPSQRQRSRGGGRCTLQFLHGHLRAVNERKDHVFLYDGTDYLCVPLCGELLGASVGCGDPSRYGADGKSDLAVCRDDAAALFPGSAEGGQCRNVGLACVLRDKHYL